MLHLPSNLPGLSAPKMVRAYRQILFGNDHKLRRLKRSVWYMHPKVFSGLPDLVLEAIIGQPLRLVFLKRFTPTSMGHYRHSLEELIHPFLFFACAILSRKWLRPEDCQRTKKRLDEKRWKQFQLATTKLVHIPSHMRFRPSSPSTLRQVIGVDEADSVVLAGSKAGGVGLDYDLKVGLLG